MAGKKRKLIEGLLPSKKPTPITPDKPGLATASRIAKKDAEIRKFAGTHGKAAAIKKYGKARVDQVPMSTKTIGKPPSVSKAGEGPHGISGQPMTGKPTLMAQDKYPSDISDISPTGTPATRYGQRGKGGIRWSTNKGGGKVVKRQKGKAVGGSKIKTKKIKGSSISASSAGFPRQVKERIYGVTAKKHGGKITYKMTGGQVVDAGYE
jgi:hypothetical protein